MSVRRYRESRDRVCRVMRFSEDATSVKSLKRSLNQLKEKRVRSTGIARLVETVAAVNCVSGDTGEDTAAS
jgi:hypothetical protein